MKLPRKKRDETSATITQTLWLITGFSFVLILGASASQPSWWTTSGAVTDNNNSTTNNSIVVNLGQVKQFTSKAVQEMNSTLPDGAGPALSNMVYTWQTNYANPTWNGGGPKPSDLQAANVGQLKYIGKQVWSRLVTAGYTNALPSWLNQTNAGDYALANIGQTKTVFNFDTTTDSDGNGLADWWEKEYGIFGLGYVSNSIPDGNGYTLLQDYLGRANPTNYYSHPGGLGPMTIVPVLSKFSGDNNSSAPGGFMPQPLIVAVTDSSNHPLQNAPVTFTVTEGSGKVAATTADSDQPETHVQVTTGANGHAQVYYLQPTDSLITGQIKATTGGQGVTFTEISTGAAQEVAAGEGFTVALKPNGTVWAWGSNDHGQLGNGTTVGTQTPGKVLGLGNVVQISVTRSHVLALRSDNTLWAWGANDQGQLGNRTTIDQPKPHQITLPTGMIQSVSAGGYSSFALMADGTLYGWGGNTQGQLGDGTTNPETAPEKIMAAGSGVTAVAAGYNNTVALKNRDVWITGSNASLQDGNNFTDGLSFVQVPGVADVTAIAVGDAHVVALESNGSVWGWGSDLHGSLADTQSSYVTATPQQIGSFTNAVAIAAAGGSTFIRFSDNSIEDVGQNDKGQLGSGNTKDQDQLQQLGNVGSISALAASTTHTIALTPTGTVVGWGDNSTYQLGQTFAVHWSTSAQVPLIPGLPNNYTAVACGEDFEAFADTGFNAWIVGNNDVGQLGTGDNASLSNLENNYLWAEFISEVFAGAHHAFFTDTSSLWASGNNAFGQLGDGTTNNQSTPVVVCFDVITSESGAVYDGGSVAGGENHSLAVMSDNSVAAWGDNRHGQLGDSSIASENIPETVSGFSGIAITQVSAGGERSFALDSDGNVYAWGENTNGELGLGTTGDVLTPTQVPNIPAMAAIAASASFTMALDRDGNIWTWGSNSHGQLGDGSTQDNETPTMIQGLSPMSAIAAGDCHAVAIQARSGLVWTWGANNDGQLGNGTFADSPNPAPIPHISNVALIAAGGMFTTLIRGGGDGTIESFGDSSKGQLGINVALYSYSPTTVLGFSMTEAVPQISLTQPTNGTVVAGDQDITLQASANSNGSGSIANVYYYLGGVQVGQATSPDASNLFDSTWTLPAATSYGDYTIRAIAYNSDGVGTMAAPVSVYLSDDQASDGLPDWWEQQYLGGTGHPSSDPAADNNYNLLQDFLGGADPSDPGSTPPVTNPAIAIMGGNNQTNAPGTFAPQQLVVRIMNGNAVLPGATVTFTVASGGGEISAGTSGLVTSMQVLTDFNGYARVSFQQPSSTDITSQINVAIGGHSISFSEISKAVAGLPILSIAPGAYTSPQTVTVSSSTTDATIYYTIDGSDPTSSDSAITNGGQISVSSNTLYKFIAMSGGASSAVKTALYRIAKAADLQAGDSFTMVRKPDNTVWTWGDGARGEQGDNLSNNPAAVPQQVPNLTGVTAIAAAGSHALAVKDGAVKAWGADDQAQDGNGGGSDLVIPTQIAGLSNVIAVYAGPVTSFALDSSGNLYAWGNNSFGQLGDGFTNNQTQPELLSITGAAKVVSTPCHTLALKSDGTVWAAGTNQSNQLGAVTGDTTNFQQVPGLVNVVDIAAGGNSNGEGHSMALLADGTIRTWGSNSYGELGDGGFDPGSATPQLVVLPLPAVSIAAVDSKSYVVLSDGTVRCFGGNSEGEMGIGNSQDQDAPVQPTGVCHVSLLAAGTTHTVVCTDSGAFSGWGDNSSCKLTQDFNTFTRDSEVHDDTSMGISMVASAENSTIALRTNGTVWAVGQGEDGVLGQGGNSWTSSEHLIQLPNLSNVYQIAGGELTAFAIDGSGVLWSWGANWNGQLGIGDTSGNPVNTPTAVLNVRNVAAVAAGDDHMLAVQLDGTVWASGDDSDEELGDASATRQAAPIQITALNSITAEAAAAGSNTSFVLDNNGSVWAWGKNDTGELGLGVFGEDVSTPTQISGLLVPMVAISARGSSAMGIDANGNVWSWGDMGNPDGTPVMQANIANVAAIASGAGFQLAVETDGSLWGWGSSNFGQLNSDSTSYIPPTQLTDLQGITALAASYSSTMLVKQDGSLSGLGDCLNGQLAGGVGIYDYSPKPLFGIALTEAPPSVSITTPSAEESSPFGNAVQFTASASASAGTITRVDYYLEGVKLGSSTTSGTWNFSYTPESFGDYTFEAVAYDSAGVAANSTPVTINVPVPPPTIAIMSGNPQTGASGALLSQPLVVSVANPDGAPMANTTVLFSVDGGEGSLSSSPMSQPTNLLKVTTDINGTATAYFKQPLVAGFSSTVTAIAANLAGQSSVDFTATTPADNGAPAAPTGLSVIAGNTAGDLDLTWINNADNATSIIVQRSTDGTNWTTIATLTDPSAISYSDPNLTVGTGYYYQVLAANNNGTDGAPAQSAPVGTAGAAVAHPAAQYSVIALDQGQPQALVPFLLNNNDSVVLVDNTGHFYFWNGKLTQMPSNFIPQDLNNHDVVSGKTSTDQVASWSLLQGLVVLPTPAAALVTTSYTVPGPPYVFSPGSLIGSESYGPTLLDDAGNLYASWETDYNLTYTYAGITVSGRDVGNTSTSYFGTAMGTAIGDVGIGADLSPNDPFDWPNYSSGGTGLTAFESNGQGVLLGNYYTSPSSDASGTSGAFSSGPMYYSSGINKLTDNYDLATINNAGEILAAVLDENENATSIVALNSTFSVPSTILSTAGWNSGDIFWNASHEITTGGYLWQPANGTQSASFNKLDALVAGSSGWSSINTSGSSLGRKEINDSGAIVGTALSTATTTDIFGSPTTTSSVHGIMILPAIQIDKVWSDQNGDTCGNVSNVNYFTNENSAGTVHGGSQQVNYLMMGFRQDGCGHVRAVLNVPGMPDAIKNKLVVQFGINSGDTGGHVTPEGGVATIENKKLVVGTDPSMLTANLIWNGRDPNNGELVGGDWMVLAGIDQNGDGKLENSEILYQTTHVIRTCPYSKYWASIVQLELAEDGWGIGAPTAASFMNAFLRDRPVRPDATPINIQPGDFSLGDSNPDKELDFNVGALFKPTIGGPIMLNEFPATNPPNDLSDEVFQSALITSMVQTSLTNNADVFSRVSHTTDSDGNWVVSWTQSGKGTNFNIFPDYDLYWAFNGCYVSDLLITATVNPSNKALIKISYRGYVTDLYDFNEIVPKLPAFLDAPSSFNRAGLYVQAGYNSVALRGGPAAGHIFKTKVDFNESRDDLTATFQ